MSAQAAPSGAVAAGAPPPGSDEASLAARARALTLRRWRLVRATQAIVLIVLLGAWEILSRLGVIDPFFFGSPLGVALQIVDWARNGTGEPGPLWQQIAVTMEEALLGFFLGVVHRGRPRRGARRGAVPGGRVPALHQSHQRAAAHRARLDLRGLARLRPGFEGGAGRRAGVLRRVLQRLPGRAQRRPQPDLERAHPRRVAACRSSPTSSSPRRPPGSSPACMSRWGSRSSARSSAST